MYGNVHGTVHDIVRIYSTMMWHWWIMWNWPMMWQWPMMWHWLMTWQHLFGRMMWYWLLMWYWPIMCHDSIGLKCLCGVDRWRGTMLVDRKMCILLAYMAINIDFDDNKPHVFIKQRFINYASIIIKWCYGI